MMKDEAAHDFTADAFEEKSGPNNGALPVHPVDQGIETSKGENLVDAPNSQSSESAECYVRLRGLPYSATETSIREWFDGIPITAVHLPAGADGRPSGEAYVELLSADNVQEALKKDRATMGTRYVEVFTVSGPELQQFLKRLEVKRSLADKGFVRVRGLPYNCTREDMDSFFKDLSIEEVIFGKDLGLGSRPNGEAYLKFAHKEQAARALDLNGQHMGRRYLEIFEMDGDAFSQFKDRMTGPIPLAKLNSPSMPMFPPPLNAYAPPARSSDFGYGYEDSYGYGAGPMRSGRAHQRGGRGNRFNPYSRGGYDYNADAYDMGPPASYGQYEEFSGGYGDVGPTKIFMRGLPFRVTCRQVEEFFQPLPCADVKFGVLPDGRASGDGIVEFRTPDEAHQALQRDRGTISNRYVELFPTDSMRLPPHVTYHSALKTAQGGHQPPAGYESQAPVPLFEAKPANSSYHQPQAAHSWTGGNGYHW